jgi:hypothetical protein
MSPSPVPPIPGVGDHDVVEPVLSRRLTQRPRDRPDHRFVPLASRAIGPDRDDDV